MNSQNFRFSKSLIMLSVLIMCVGPLAADQFGLFTYRVINSTEIEITDYPATETGQVEVPAQIVSLPVTRIAYGAFRDCTGLTGVTIPSGLNYIGASAFENCSALASITIPSTVATIGGRAFLGCTALTSIVMPPSITSIGDYLFANCSGLTNIVIPAGVTTIPTRAFYGCGGLTSVTLPGGLTSIGTGAFQSCDKLSSITIPASVSSIGTDAFAHCGRLASILVEPGNLHYASVNGVLLNAAIKELIQFPQGRTGSYALPGTITAIPDQAFSASARLTGITIPGSVTRIGEWAFYGCGGLTEVFIPANVSVIGASAFAYCTSLTLIEVEAGNPAFVSIDGALINFAQTELLQYPAGRTGSYAVPPEVTQIWDNAFKGCAGLTSVTLPAGLTMIGAWAFSGCSGLTEVILPAGLVDIGHGAFSYCAGLTGIVIPAGVASIGRDPFGWCGNLASIEVEPDNLNYVSVDGVLLDAAQTVIIAFPQAKSGAYALPATVTRIEWGAFDGCSGLSSIAIPASVTTIADYVFVGCSSLTAITVDPGSSHYCSVDGVLFNHGQTELLKYPEAKSGEYTIPGTVTNIANGAFAYCIGLTAIAIPVTAVDFGSSSPFYGCSALQAITVDAGNPGHASINGVLFDAAGGKLLRYPSGRQGAYEIPAGITSVGTGAFDGCAGLTRLFVPASVAAMEDEWRAPFYGCSALASIEVDPANPNFSSSDGVLFDDAMTTLIRVPESKAGTCMVPWSVTEISYAAFHNCTRLTLIAVDPANPAFIDLDGVLFDAAGTTLLQYPGGRSGPYAVPAQVTDIDPESFYNRTLLTSITIPSGVGDLSPAYVFSGCTGLSTAVFLGDAPGDSFPGSPFGPYFAAPPPSFTVYYLQGRGGFTSPTWRGLPAVEIDTVTYPAASWLLAHDLWYDTDLQQDLNGDGVDLLMAYALNLDPNDNLAGRMPKPVFAGNQMGMTFHAASPGITYTVQTSTDLQTWVTDGVSLSALAPDNTRTATVDRLSPLRFLRLVVDD